MVWYTFPPSMTVAERKARAAKEIAARAKVGAKLAPVRLEGRTIASTFWGKSWCDNLERYRDFAYRLERGRSYVRSGAVIDLVIEHGRVRALVSGSDVYRVEVHVAAADRAHFEALAGRCAGAVDSLLALLQGRLDAAVMKHLCDPAGGLFPKPAEIELSCTCPDHATMCKHVAAVLYGVGARLDHAPELLFVLRQADAAELVAHAASVGPTGGRRSARRLSDEDDDLAALFGVELDADAAGPKTKVSAAKAKVSGAKAKTSVKAKAKIPTAQAAKAKTPAAKAKTAAKPKAKTTAAQAAKAKAPAAKAKAKKPGKKSPARVKRAAPAGRRA